MSESYPYDFYGAVIRLRCTRCGEDMEIEYESEPEEPVRCTCGREWSWSCKVMCEEAERE